MMFYSVARADDGSDDGMQGGDISGLENLDQVIILQPTVDAPTNSSGLVEIEAEDDNGTNNVMLSVQTIGLADGTYTLTVTRKSDGTSVDLGTFDVSSLGLNWDDDGDGDILGDDDNDPLDDGGDICDIEFGDGSGIPLPDGLSPMDIATVSVKDGNGVVMLTGDATDLSQLVDSAFDAVVNVNAGPAAPTAQGQAALHSSVKSGKQKSKFSLQAQNAPANSTLTVNINGTPQGTVKSNRRGEVKLRKLPQGVDPSQVHSVQLLDGSSNVVCSAQF